MRKMIALFVSMAFILGTTGFAVAQTSTPTPAPAPAPAEKKADDKSMEKKPASHKKMTMEEKKAVCLREGRHRRRQEDQVRKAIHREEPKKAAATGQRQHRLGRRSSHEPYRVDTAQGATP